MQFFHFGHKKVEKELGLEILLHSSPPFGQDDVRHVVCLGEERRNLLVGESSDAAADAGDQERKLRVLMREGDELVDVGPDALHAALHSGDVKAFSRTAKSFVRKNNLFFRNWLVEILQL